MQKLADKLLIIGLCLLIMTFSQVKPVFVVALLASAAVSSLCEYLENKIPAYLCAVYVILCLFVPGFIVFLPIVVYDCSGFENRYLRFCWAAALFVNFFTSDPRIAAAAALLSGAAFLWQYRTTGQLKIREEFFNLTDSAREHSMSLEHKNRELMEKQDYEVRLATLKERNRIAREIHDNVGHLLTRAILQLSALSMTYPGGNDIKEELSLIKKTMSEAMDSVRNSVHDLHDESVDLKMQLELMIGGFGFCPVKLFYDAGELPGALKYCFIAVAREALSNIAKHSDATEAAISVAEHPAFCRISVEDNGSAKTADNSRGIGLRGMADRVEALGGVFRAEYNKGFKIFISVPKEKGSVKI
ncbi:MAG: histidine kinase [Oscillospiraceae bacterium]|nr:histidine kinase [Oscillospiraceae bacterium]